MSILNPPEREQYRIGKLVKKGIEGATEGLIDYFQKASNRKASKKAVMDQGERVFKSLQNTPANVKLSDAKKAIAKKENLSVSYVNDIDKFYREKAGGGSTKNAREEFGKAFSTATTMVKEKATGKSRRTEGQKRQKEIGGGDTLAAREKGLEYGTVAGVGGTALGIGGTLAVQEFLSGLSSSAETKVKENKSGSVTDITSGTMDAAFSKASKNPSTYVFMKSGMPHFKYKGKAIPFSLATEEDDVVLDMTPRTKKNLGSLFEALEGKNVDPKMDRTLDLDPEELIDLPGGGKIKVKDLAKLDRGMIKKIPKDFDEDDALLGLFGRIKSKKDIPTDAEMEREAKEKEKKKSRFNEGSLIGGQKEIDANDDGDITAEDFAILRDRKAEGSKVYPEEPKLDEKNKFISDKMKELINSGELKSLTLARIAAKQLAEKKFGPDRLLMSPERRGEMDKNIRRHMEMMKILEEREKKVDGGMPVDTYPNIPPEEMEEVMASQLPDDEMEEDYIKFVMDESLDDSEQDYLAEALTKDERLSDIMDKVITTASEFSGAGEVDGPGTGVSDSIPARLSDGEFVFTKKATDQLGADNLQRMMDDAERAYDGGLQQMNIGGMPRQEEEELEEGRFDMGKTDEEIKKLMIGANKMPSVQ